MNLRPAVLICCLAPSAFGAFERTSQGSEIVGMGGACVGVPENPWTACCNPGALRTLTHRSLSLSYIPQPFGLKELARAAFFYVEPMSMGTWGISGSRFGFDLYREVIIGLSFSMTFGDGFSAGCTLNYFSLAIQNYGSGGTFGVDVGFLVEFSRSVQWGFSASNINTPTIGASKEALPQVYATGVHFRPTDDASLGADIVKDIRYPAELHVGIAYTIVGVLEIRGGTATEPSLYTAGTGVHYKFLRLDYAFSMHQNLGATHSFSLSITLE